MATRMYNRQIIPENTVMSLRDYKQYALQIYGPQSINEFMMRVMSVASVGRNLTRLEWDKMVVGIKLKNAEIMGRK